MTKQEEIREGMGRIIDDSLPLHSIRSGGAVFTYAGKKPLQELILDYQHSQGCVLKVDRELPTNTTREVVPGDMQRSMELRRIGDGYYKKAQQDMLKAGYVAVESLIKEKK